MRAAEERSCRNAPSLAVTYVCTAATVITEVINALADRRWVEPTSKRHQLKWLYTEKTGFGGADER